MSAADLIGTKLLDVPVTPIVVVDRTVVEANCKAMLSAINSAGVAFRPHVKTHKTVQGTRLQLQDNRDGRVVCSTLQEIEGLCELVDEGLVKDILYGIPPGRAKARRLMQRYLLDKRSRFKLRFLCDSVTQAQFLAEEVAKLGIEVPVSVMIKIDCGTHRAGVAGTSLEKLIAYLLTSKLCVQTIELYGFYSHAGHSYGSRSLEQAAAMLETEISSVQAAASIARQLRSDLKFVLSVGATPTARAFEILQHRQIAKGPDEIEIHAGCYAFNDLQQLATGLLTVDQIAGRVLTEVLSHYPNRAVTTGALSSAEADEPDICPDELLIDAGCLGLARETGPIPGYGLSEDGRWVVTRISQEHGILAIAPNLSETLRKGKFPAPATWSVPVEGDRLLIIPQHMCITAANFRHIHVVDSFDDEAVIVDVWERWAGH
ncbi:hypothetical protein PYCC9005_000026 [Savitreella phatthalungensis]